jgi:hypothetical protein
MKKTAFMAIVLVFLMSFSLSAQDQVTEKKEDQWSPWKNPTVDSITAKYKYTPPAPVVLTPEKIFPVLGNFEVNEAREQSVNRLSIVLDEQNKGIAWVDGLPQGRIRAMLKKSPATYKIPAQKTAEGKDISEGTLMYDKETNTLSICIGKAYNDADPGMAFMVQEPAPVEKAVVSRKKTKVVKARALQFTGKKIEDVAIASGN